MRARNFRVSLPEWWWIPSAWIVFALFDAAKTVGVMRSEGMHHNWPVLFALEAISWAPWAAATGLIATLGRRLAPYGRKPLTWAAHVLFGIVIGIVFSAWTTLLVIDFHPFGAPSPPGFLPHLLDTFYGSLPLIAVFYVCILMIAKALDDRARTAAHSMEVARLNEQIALAQLSALRRQIEPHFLFNALNAAAGLVREGRGAAAVDMIASLSDFLRKTLEGSNRHEVPLTEELEFVRQYLAIQQTRFADRLQLDIDVPAALSGAAVPNLILQPLVENAVNHGIAKRKDGGTVRIRASANEDSLTLNVSNDGPNLRDGWAGGRGIGISNVRARLQSLYAKHYAFDIHDRLGGVDVSISIPLRMAGRASESAS